MVPQTVADTDATVNPDAEEIWYNGIDNIVMNDDFDQDGDGDPIAEIDVDGDGVIMRHGTTTTMDF